jgi:hypothetical protein
VVVLGPDLRAPAPHDLVDEHADAEHAARVQALEQLQVTLAERRRRERRLLADHPLELDLAQPLLERGEGVVLREDEPSGVDERAIRPPALPEVARVLGQDVVRQHGGHPQLVSAADVEMETTRVQGPRREADVEGRLAAVVVDAVRIRVGRRRERRGARRHAGQQEDRDQPGLPHAVSRAAASRDRACARPPPYGARG